MYAKFFLSTFLLIGTVNVIVVVVAGDVVGGGVGVAAAVFLLVFFWCDVEMTVCVAKGAIMST